MRVLVMLAEWAMCRCLHILAQEKRHALTYLWNQKSTDHHNKSRSREAWNRLAYLNVGLGGEKRETKELIYLHA